jgi:hypothetical protein
MPTPQPHRYDDARARLSVVLSVALLWLGLPCRLAAAQAVPPGPAGQPAQATPGQPYRQIQPDERLKQDRLRVTKILLAGRFADDQERGVFDRYYKLYIFARWSLPENRTMLTAFRKELHNNLRSTGTGGRPREVHDYLNDLALKTLDSLSTGNYHPATRVNAMFMIGELNEVEAATAATLPTPQPDALPVLVAAVRDPQQLQEVKVAALVGIARHAQLGGVNTAPAQASVTAAMLALASTATPPGPAAAGHAWMRAQAAEILGELGVVGNNGAVARALSGIVADATLPFSTRATAAKAIGKLDFRGASGLNTADVAKPLGQLAVDVCAAEVKAQAVSRDRLKAHFLAAKLGLTALAAGASGTAQQTLLAQLGNSVTTMLDALENRQLDDSTMLQTIEQEATKLRNSLKTGPAPPTAPPTTTNPA